MPCQSGYTVPEEIYLRDIEIRKIKAELDRLTHDNDRLREIIISSATQGANIPAADWRWVTKDQIAHRKEDLKRLEKTLRAAIADQMRTGYDKTVAQLYTKLGAVVSADPSKPLQDQLGFDPDSI